MQVGLPNVGHMWMHLAPHACLGSALNAEYIPCPGRRLLGTYTVWSSLPVHVEKAVGILWLGIARRLAKVPHGHKIIRNGNFMKGVMKGKWHQMIMFILGPGRPREGVRAFGFVPIAGG